MQPKEVACLEPLKHFKFVRILRQGNTTNRTHIAAAICHLTQLYCISDPNSKSVSILGQVTVGGKEDNAVLLLERTVFSEEWVQRLAYDDVAHVFEATSNDIYSFLQVMLKDRIEAPNCKMSLVYPATELVSGDFVKYRIMRTYPLFLILLLARQEILDTEILHV